MTKPQVLIVEDERVVAKDIEYRVAKMNYAVSGIASSGKQAVKKAAESPPDIVLMDIKLKGGMDGIEAAKQIRSAQDISIIYLTAYADDELLQRAKATEPAGYIVKPFNERELYSVIEMALHKRAVQKGLLNGEKARRRESEERFYKAFHSSPVAMTLGSLPEGRWIDVNDSFLRLIEYTRDEVIGHTSAELGLFPDSTERARILQSLREEGMVRNHELTTRTKTGKLVTVLLSLENITINGQGHAISIVVNITERKQAEEKLRQSEEKYRLMVKEIKDYAIIMLDPDGHVASWNEGAELLLGYHEEEITGKHRSIFFTKEDIEQGKPQRQLQVAIAEGSYEDEGWRVRKDGSQFWANMVITALKNESGNLYGFVNITRDLTERKRAELHIKKLYSLQAAVRNINQELLRFQDEVELFHKVCTILSRVEFISAVWIGMAAEGSFDIKPVAQAGFDPDFLSAARVTWDDSEYGQGPSGKAMKTRQPVIINDVASDPSFAPWRAEAMKRGTAASMSLPLIYENEAIGIINVHSARENAFGDEEINFLTEVANDITVGIRASRLQKELSKSLDKQRLTLNSTVEAIGLLCEIKDPYTAGHERRVTSLATAIAGEMNLSKDTIDGIEIASHLHDLGKLTLPTEILTKPGKLSDLEFAMIKEHPGTAHKILKGLEFPWPVAQIVLQHHERMDGSGYPQGLTGDDICLEAQILAVADVVEAMASHRPYRPALGAGIALEEISQKRGILYDADVADACVRLFYEKGFKLD